MTTVKPNWYIHLKQVNSIAKCKTEALNDIVRRIQPLKAKSKRYKFVKLAHTNSTAIGHHRTRKYDKQMSQILGIIRCREAKLILPDWR